METGLLSGVGRTPDAPAVAVDDHRQMIWTRTGRAHLASALAVLALSSFFVVMALATAGGSRLEGDAEVVDPFWWNMSYALCLPVFAAAWRQPSSAITVVVAALLPQIVLVKLYWDREVGNPLVGMVLLFPLLLAILFSVAALVGTFMNRPARPVSPSHVDQR